MKFPNYTSRENEYFGVLFSYMLSLILISMLEYKKIIIKFNTFVNFIIRVIVILLIAFIYINMDIEFEGEIVGVNENVTVDGNKVSTKEEADNYVIIK